MTTKARYRSGNLEYYDSATKEIVTPFAMVRYHDDFLGKDFLASESGSPGTWETIETNLNTAIALIADEANGVLRGIIDNDSNAELATVYWGDQKGVSVKQGAVFETRIRVSTSVTSGTDIVWGMAGDANAVSDTITESAWFKVDGGTSVVAESDDTTNNNDDKSTSITAGTTDWRIYTIDFTTIADVGFYIDGVAVATATTFDMSNLTDAEAVMQPYISGQKASGTSVGTFDIDYVRVWSNRS